jgi:DNA-dependent RNA polymerase auxiliary subunit epsilon
VLERKDTTNTDKSASYIGLQLEIDSEGRLRAKLYDKRDDFNIPFVNFSAAPAYEVYICHLILYSRAC